MNILLSFHFKKVFKIKITLGVVKWYKTLPIQQ